ncbi:MAG: FprA family A-type flavoprotein [Elusimicrobiota bacterium]|jgi:flavorubredoxin|nr:FprA family A-type flavoprotein [Elusimicrobiota bacterium]
MSAVKIKENVYAVGIVDWNQRDFHGSTYKTIRGVTYNSYLIKDDKTVLIDLVHKGFEKEFLDNIRQVVDPSKIDIVIINHIEPDHSGAFCEIVKVCSNAKFYGTQKAKEGLFKYYGVLPSQWQSVKTNDSINIGKRTLHFIDTPMLHWPDSMFTYSPQDKILFSNDGFGQHYAANKVFDDEVNKDILFSEAQKYYANILLPYGSILSAKLNALSKTALDIDIIAPSHGLVWRANAAEILDKYTQWSSNICKNKIAVIYETMWKSSETMARKIMEGISSQGAEGYIFDLAVNDRTDIVSYILDSKGIIFGSSTHDNVCLPIMAGFIHFFKGLKVKNRKSFAFGSFGWGGGAVKEIEEVLKGCEGFELFPSISIQYAPNQEELSQCFQAGSAFAKAICSCN